MSDDSGATSRIDTRGGLPRRRVWAADALGRVVNRRLLAVMLLVAGLIVVTIGADILWGDGWALLTLGGMLVAASLLIGWE